MTPQRQRQQPQPSSRVRRTADIVHRNVNDIDRRWLGIAVGLIAARGPLLYCNTLYFLISTKLSQSKWVTHAQQPAPVHRRFYGRCARQSYTTPSIASTCQRLSMLFFPFTVFAIVYGLLNTSGQSPGAFCSRALAVLTSGGAEEDVRVLRSSHFLSSSLGYCTGTLLRALTHDRCRLVPTSCAMIRLRPSKPCSCTS